MNNIAINTLNYTGIVTLSQYIGNKKIKLAQMHNTGGTSLFNFLANCLAGNFTSAKTNWPTKIKILERTAEDENTQNYEYRSVTGFIFLRSAPEVLDNSLGECRVRYSFMIPRDLLESIPSIDTLGLGLYTNNAVESEPGNFAAFCAFGPDLLLDSGDLLNASLLVDWELVITNSSK